MPRRRASCLLILLGMAQERGARTVEDALDLGVAAPRPAQARRRHAARVPAGPGVYILRDANGQALYVGKAGDLQKRVRSYFGSRRQKPALEAALGALARVDTVPFGSELEAALVELELIRAWRPPANSRSTRPERGRYLRLGIADPVPLLALRDAPREDGALYAGPLASRRTAETAARGAARRVRAAHVPAEGADGRGHLPAGPPRPLPRAVPRRRRGRGLRAGRRSPRALPRGPRRGRARRGAGTPRTARVREALRGGVPPRRRPRRARPRRRDPRRAAPLARAHRDPARGGHRAGARALPRRPRRTGARLAHAPAPRRSLGCHGQRAARAGTSGRTSRSRARPGPGFRPTRPRLRSILASAFAGRAPGVVPIATSPRMEPRLVLQRVADARARVPERAAVRREDRRDWRALHQVEPPAGLRLATG